MAPLTAEQVLALAPDPASAKAGSSLATARKWSNLGRDADARLVWGECQGSGSSPYRTQADLSEPAFRCTCPSRKFPCKHALGLLLLLAADETQFKVLEWPAWVAEWVASRQDRVQKRAVKKEHDTDREERPVDPEAKAKRVAARADKISVGLAELDLWMRDLVRGGLAGVEARPSSFFHGLAARLVDAQAPGAARLVRELAWIPSSGDGWHARMLARLGRLHLLTQAWSRFDGLSPELQADVRAHVGWPITESELTDASGIDDEWMLIGQFFDEDERLRMRKTWVHGRTTDRLALLLHFAHGNAPFTDLLPAVGASIAAELVFFPGSLPQRAFIRSRRDQPEAGAPRSLPTGERRLSQAVGAFARALALDPWIERVPLVLDGVIPEQTPRGWRLRDEADDVVPIAPGFHGWPLMAVSGGRPLWLSAEWTGERLVPLAAFAGDTVLPLAAA